MVRVFRYRLSPTPAQDRALRAQLGLCRELYNAALQERRDAYKATGKSPSLSQQDKSIPEIMALRPEFRLIFYHTLQHVLKRLDKAFQAFFRRCKAGEKPGYPRFKGRDRFRTLIFPDGGKLCAGDKRLYVPKIGKVKIKLHRPIEGMHGETRVRLDGDGHWYASLVCKNVPTKPLPAKTSVLGLDVGIESFVVTSDGQVVENPRPLQSARLEMERAQRRVSKRKRGSKRRRKAAKILARKHAHVVNVRKDFQHKVARRLVRKHQVVVVEDLNVRGLASGMLAQQVSDVAWTEFIGMLEAKAEEAGRELIKVDPRGTSQECSGCGAVVRKDLSVRVHHCSRCGMVAHRDLNAARVIQARGVRVRRAALQGETAKTREAPALA
jgi:putative transposase